jgi:prophage regulatory protein
MATTSALPSINPIYRRPLVLQITGDSRSTLYRKIAQGLFTHPVNLGNDKSGNPCQVGWPANEVETINNARIAGKSDDEIRKLVLALESARQLAAQKLDELIANQAQNLGISNESIISTAAIRHSFGQEPLTNLEKSTSPDQTQAKVSGGEQ